jgi:DNA polymerase-3 subunit alpha
VSFVHLHTHSHYSMLDATLRIEELVERARQDEAPAIALTDHNNMFGAVEFFKAAKSAGIRPILGAELNLVPEDRRDPEVRRSATIVLLCKDSTGYANLCYLLSRAYMDAPPRSPGPRIDRGLLAERAEGLIALSGNLSGEIPQLLLRGEVDEAARLARHYGALFHGHFYLELIRNGIKEQEQVNAQLIQLSEELELPLVATADAHYDKPADAAAHEVLMCIQMGKCQPTLDTVARLTDALHLAPAEEMAVRFSDQLDAVSNANLIAELCDVDLKLGQTFLPDYNVPEGFKTPTYLAHLAREGLQRRMEAEVSRGRVLDRDVYEARLAEELEIIEQMGFSGYFLIVWDFIARAVEMGVPVGPGRGSGAGSLVAYSLRITNIDPMEYNLLFERFLNPERVSMPDFDIDFCMNKRDQVIRYVCEKYGDDNVGQIITYGSMKAKAVVRDVARVLGLAFGEADRAAKLVPDDLGMTLSQAFEDEPRLQELCDSDPRYERLFEVARSLEGLKRQPGMHAAGIVISDRPLWEYVPLYAVANDDGTVTRVTQYAKDEVEEAGLVKFDFLGLKTLTVVDHAVRLINAGLAEDGAALDIDEIPLDDPKVFQLITGGNTTGVFQLESSLFKDLLRRLKPDRFEDIIAAVALGRPGPLKSGMADSYILRKHGLEEVSYPHPSLKDLLAETNGVMVYQEQVMQVASVLAGYSLGQADILRRAMGKKKKKEMDSQREVFIAGAQSKGVEEGQAKRIFAQMETFAEYGFNKSHSAAYGLIAYQTAWLKTNHPVEFMAALLTADGDNTDKVVRFIGEARAMKITVLPPSVNDSGLDFTVTDGAIRFGLGAIKGVGAGAVECVLAARDDDGPFVDLFDFTERVDLRRVNRRVLEALVKCGAFDEFSGSRQGLFAALDMAIERGQAHQRDRDSGQFNLFGELEASAPEPAPAPDAPEPLVDDDEWPDKIRLGFEKECLGFYVSGHPLDTYTQDIERLGCTPLARLAQVEDRSKVVVGAVVTDLRERPLKSGNGRMAFAMLEDLGGRAELLVFSKVFPDAEAPLKADEPILVEATLQHEGEGDNISFKLRAERVRTLSDVRSETARRIRIELDPARAQDDGLLGRLQQRLLASATGLPVEVVVIVPELGRALVRLGGPHRMPPDDDSVHALERIVGRGRVTVL